TDADTLTSWASAIFLVFVVCGPGLLAKSLFSLLVPAEAHAKNRRRLLREIKRAETVRMTAIHEIRLLQNWHSWYVQEANRMRAIYTLAYREASGKTPDTTPEAEKAGMKPENPYQP